MMRTAMSISAIATLFLAFSCNTRQLAEQTKEIDSLGVHLNRVREIVEGFDSAKVDAQMKEIEQFGNWLFENVTDTLDPKDGLLLGDFMRSKKYMSKTMSSYQVIKRELAYSEKQLNSFRKDVSNGLIADEDYSKHFQTESSAIAALADAAEQLESEFKSNNEQFAKRQPLVTAFIDSVKSVIYSSSPIVPKKS